MTPDLPSLARRVTFSLALAGLLIASAGATLAHAQDIPSVRLVIQSPSGPTGMADAICVSVRAVAGVADAACRNWEIDLHVAAGAQVSTTALQAAIQQVVPDATIDRRMLRLTGTFELQLGAPHDTAQDAAILARFQGDRDVLQAELTAPGRFKLRVRQRNPFGMGSLMQVWVRTTGFRGPVDFGALVPEVILHGVAAEN